MANSKTRFMQGAAAGAIISGFAAMSAVAQEEAATPATEDVAEVLVITGSYIPGRAEDAALPVDVFSSDELARQGIDSPLEFIKTLPSVGQTLGDTNQFAAGTEQGVGSINLRGLGRERTLVLFNGRRTIPTPGDGAADTQLVPLFALDRIEILKDGAASTYGSDAIAGVANFVTKQGFEGVEVSGDYTIVDGSDGNYKASILGGRNFGQLNVMGGFGFQHRSELRATERDYASLPYEVNPSPFSALSNPGTYIPRVGDISQGAAGTALGLGIDGALLDACGDIGGVNGVFVGLPVCRYSFANFDNLIEDEDRYQGYFQGTYEVDDTLELNAEFLLSHVAVDNLAYSPSYPPTQGPLGPGSSQAFSVPRSNPGFEDFLTQTFPADSPAYFANYASILLFRPFALGGNPGDPTGAARGGAEADAYRFSIGGEKDFTSDFGAQLYVTHNHSKREAFAPDIVGGRLQDALNGFGGPDCTGDLPGANGCLYFNPFINSAPQNPALGLANPAYVPGNESSQEVIDWFSAPSGTTSIEDQYIVDLIFAGNSQWRPLGAESFGYAFGAQYRTSTFEETPLNDFSNPLAVPCAIEGDLTCLDDPNDSNFPTGPFIFLGQYEPTDLKQDVYALFGEASFVFPHNLEVTGAIRFEDYGGEVGSTTNPKISARWQATDMLALRGSVGSTFRGPLPSDLESDDRGVAGIDAIGGAFKAFDSLGNPNLSPETALTTNFGVLLSGDNWNFNVDYWTYDFEDRYADLPLQAIANAVAGGVGDGSQLVDCASPFVEFVVFEGDQCVQGTTVANDINRLSTFTVNGPDVKTSGLDFSGSFNTQAGAADLAFGANATYVSEFEVGEFVYNGLTFSTAYDAVGFANYGRAPGTVSQWRANAFANASIGGLDATYALQYIDGVTDNRCPADDPCATTEFGPTDFAREVGSYLQHDLLFTYRAPVSSADVALRFAVENLLDEDPSAARLELGYDPYIGNPLGRVFKFGVDVSY